MIAFLMTNGEVIHYLFLYIPPKALNIPLSTPANALFCKIYPEKFAYVKKKQYLCTRF